MIHTLYNLAIRAFNAISLRHARYLKRPKKKFARFCTGQLLVFRKLEHTEMRRTDTRPTLWIHASSYGEYNAARPIIQRLHDAGTWRIVLTFFSPTGVDLLHYRHPLVDEVYYLPLDTPRNVTRFLDIVRPQKAIFVISEYWVNYLIELHRRRIPTYLLSAHITPKAPFLRWYGGMFREALKAFTRFLVLDEESRQHLAQIGFTNVTVTSDPLFDNVVARARTDYHNPIIERFARDKEVFVVGSLTDMHDLYLTAALSWLHKRTRFIIVPHEITPQSIRQIQRALLGHAILYSECTEETPFDDVQALIIDFMGALAYIYRYGQMAYVGGGFGSTLHSVIEAAVYGIPVAFGPNIRRQRTAQILLDNEVGTAVTKLRELNKWFKTMQAHPETRRAIYDRCQQLIEEHSGATDAIVAELS